MSKHPRCNLDHLVDPAAECENVKPNKRCKVMIQASGFGPPFSPMPTLAAACQPFPSPNPAASGSGSIFSFQPTPPSGQPGLFTHPTHHESHNMSSRLLAAAGSSGDNLHQELEHIFCCPGRHESQRLAMHCLLQLLRHQNTVVSINAANSLWAISERGKEYFDQLVHLGLLEVVTGLARVPHLSEFCLTVIEKACPCYRTRLLQTNVTSMVQSFMQQSGVAPGTQGAAMRVLALLDSDWWKKCMVRCWQPPSTN